MSAAHRAVGRGPEAPRITGTGGRAGGCFPVRCVLWRAERGGRHEWRPCGMIVRRAGVFVDRCVGERGFVPDRHALWRAERGGSHEWRPYGNLRWSFGIRSVCRHGNGWTDPDNSAPVGRGSAIYRDKAMLPPTSMPSTLNKGITTSDIHRLAQMAADSRRYEVCDLHMRPHEQQGSTLNRQHCRSSPKKRNKTPKNAIAPPANSNY